MILVPDAVIATICRRCERAIGECEGALAAPLVTEEQQEDNPESRRHLERSASAARRLKAHLEAGYEFINANAEYPDGFAEPKEAADAAN
jgi:hypothetical protein